MVSFQLVILEISLIILLMLIPYWSRSLGLELNTEDTAVNMELK